MTEPIETPTPTGGDAAVDTSAPEPEADDGPMTLAEAKKLRRENQSLRTRLHESEEQIGAAAAREAARDRAEVERIAAEHLIDATDIWRAQPDLAAYYDSEFHEITKDRVVETAKALAAEKPHLAKPNTAPPPTDRPIEGLRTGSAPEPKQESFSWSSALRGR